MENIAPDQWNVGLTILRTVVGVTMLAHGINHVWRGGRIPGTARWFAGLGMRPGVLHAWLASATELVAGPMLVLGLLTPLAAGACAGVMLVAWVVNHRKNGFFIFRPGEGYEYVMNLFVACIALACLGAGEWSLDEALDTHFSDWWGLVTGLVVGVGGAVGLLVTFWRPPTPAAAND
jgi:putative oxidoreductase